jgi:hypothetical protein
LQQPDGQARSINLADLKSSTTSRVSLMPERLMDSLTAKEASDLLEFIVSFK